MVIINAKTEAFGREIETIKNGNWRIKKYNVWNKVLLIMAGTL